MGLSARGSTAGDFGAFAALTSNTLLDAKHIRLLTTKKVSNGEELGPATGGRRQDDDASDMSG